MSNRLKVFPPAIVVLIILVISVFATPALLPKGTTTAGKESLSMSSEDLMAYLQWKHNYLANTATRDAETERILEYPRWKHIKSSDADQKISDAEMLMNYLQWKHNQPSRVVLTSSGTERLLKYLEWKHIQDPG